jgi:hypothetical protein
MCLIFKFGGAFSYVTLDLRYPLCIVFLTTLGTMCRFSLGLGKAFMSFAFCLFLVIFLKNKKLKKN